MLAPWIIQHFPPHLVYVEPYAGGASVLLRKPRSHGEVYNDLNSEVVNLFQVLRDPERCAQLREALDFTPYSRVEWERSYELTDDPVEAARRLVVRSYMGHGSAAVNRGHSTGFRANSSRRGTVPARDWANKPASLPAVTERLRGVTIECRPALQIIEVHDAADTLFYVDPPYVADTRRRYAMKGVRQCYAHEMEDDDHRELADSLKVVKGMVVLSGYAGPLYSDLYADWLRIETRGFCDGALDRTESLWLNPACAEALDRLGGGATIVGAVAR